MASTEEVREISIEWRGEVGEEKIKKKLEN